MWIVFQVDQTASPHQAILWSQRQRGAVANLDRDVCLSPYFDGEKTGRGVHALRNITNIKCSNIPQRAAFLALFIGFYTSL